MSEKLSEGQDVKIQCSATDSFAAWLAHSRGSLAISTYQAGKVALVGVAGGQLHLLMRQFDKPLGLAVDGTRIALATRRDVCLFANAPHLAYEYLEDQPGRYDALYLPRVTYHVGDLHAHDLAYGRDGLWVVNTRFSCLSVLSENFHFEPKWRPKFVTDLVPEDRCHLNGLALVDGQPKYVTVLGRTDTAGGWRENKASGGMILDVDSDETVLDGLSMPHSPRTYQGQLYVLNSGNGELLKVDPEKNTSDVVCFLPGYLRGLSFVGPYALVGMSHIREKHIFGGLPIQERTDSLTCGVAVVELATGKHVATFEFTSGCTELYDVSFLPGVQRPNILNMEREAVHDAITNPDSSYWLRKSKQILDEPKENTKSDAGREKSEGGAPAPTDSVGTAPSATTASR